MRPASGTRKIRVSDLRFSCRGPAPAYAAVRDAVEELGMQHRLLFHPPAHPEPPRHRAWYYGMLAAGLLAAGLAYLVLTGVELE